MPIVPGIAYPTIEQVLTLARGHLNQLMAGATLFQDADPEVLPFLNDAIADYQRELHSSSIQTFIKEVFLDSFPPINSPLGVGTPNPEAQQNLNYSGFFDGYQNYASPALPSDCLAPLQVWQRNTGSGQPYTMVTPRPLISRYQGFDVGNWEWRGDAIYWNGALIQKDIRLRYTATVSFFASTTPPSSFASTPIPLNDSLTALALGCAIKYSAARTGQGATAELQAKWQTAVDGVINRQVKSKQYDPAYPSEFGDSMDWVWY